MQKVFCVYDSKAECAIKFFNAQTRGVALRDFAEGAQKEGTFLNSHPADFTLFEIGEWNEFTMQIVPYEAKVALGTALEYVNSEGQREVGNLQLVPEREEQ